VSRQILARTVILLILAGVFNPADVRGSARKAAEPCLMRHGMVLREPAKSWKEALPCGNGSVGAMAYGQPRDETILLNHEALFYPVWEKPKEVANMSQYLPELRRLISQGQYCRAEKFWNGKLAENDYALQRGPFTNPYHPACDLVIRRRGGGAEVEDYRQSLDFEKAEVVARWKEGDEQYERSMFVSRSDDVVVVRLRGSGVGSLTAKIALVPHEPQKDIFPVRMGRDRDYMLARKAYKGDPIEYSTGLSDDECFLHGRYWDGREFGAVARVKIRGGHQRIDESSGMIEVLGATEVMVTVKLFANERDAEAAIRRLKSDLAKLPQDYGKLLAKHVALHRELFLRMVLDLEGGEERNLSNAELLAKARDGEMPAGLVERLFDFGRYVLICSSRPGGLPANLQGLWSGTWTPSWSCDYTLNENVQMAYWQALPGNMAEVTQPYFDYFDSLIPDWKINARRFWGCRGIEAFMRSSDHGLMVQNAPWQFYTASAGWLGQLYYDYYLFTGDKDFLKNRAVPFLKQVALFYEDFLTEGSDGKYVFSPSMSPENRPANTRCKTAVNATMDVAVAGEVLTNLISACELLGIEQKDVERWRKMLAKLPSYQFDSDGVLKEWIHPDLANRDEHRHMSHIYPLFPGFEVDSDEGDAALRHGCRVVLNRKFGAGGEGFGWSFAHQGSGFARLGEAEKAFACLRWDALTCSEKNLLSFHEPPDGPFQIDGNCGFSSTVLEMLLYSRHGVIKVLPALPGSWIKGKAKHILARGGVEVSLEWDMQARIVNMNLKSRIAQSLDVRFPSPVKGFTVANARCTRSSRGSGYLTVALPDDKDVQVYVELEAEKNRGIVLKSDSFRHYVEQFNADDTEYFPPSIPNAQAWDFLDGNIPLLECPDRDIEEIYYFRWWTYRKHIKKTPDGYVIDEFRPKVSWGGKYNTISCAAGHHIYEGRWLHEPQIMDDYERFWVRGGGDARKYSFWLADSYYARYLVQPDKGFITGLLDDLVANYVSWQKSHQLDNGMFWQYDVADGMEESICGSRHNKNIRPTINSYMYGDSVAISKIAEMAGRKGLAEEYRQKALKLKALVQENLWDDQAKFFKVLLDDGNLCTAREAIGYIPWYFNLPDAGYEQAWKQLMDPQGFYAPYGPTTAEQRHPGFRLAYVGDDCQWNGPSWPYSTTQVLTALANVLNNYKQDYVGKADYFKTLKIYTASQHLLLDDGSVVPWIDEDLDPYTGQWIARLRKLQSASFQKRYRGKDYNHSGYCDLIISGLIGLRARADEVIEVNPLLPQDTWDWFCLDNVLYHGRIITIVWDKTGRKYGKGPGFHVYADGKEIARLDRLGRVTAGLPVRRTGLIPGKAGVGEYAGCIHDKRF